MKPLKIILKMKKEKKIISIKQTVDPPAGMQ